jgi:alanine racemase
MGEGWTSLMFRKRSIRKLIALDYTHASDMLSSLGDTFILCAMNPQNEYSTWVEVDLEAIEENVRYFLQSTGKQCMAVVKAEAYGHGALQIAKTACKAGASWLGVARAGEALALRAAGIDEPIFLLGWTPPGRMEALIKANVSLAFWSEAQLADISKAAEKVGGRANVHLKIDTGMSRVGVKPEAASHLAQEARRMPNLHLEGVFTHFAKADESDMTSTDSQLRIFREIVDNWESSGPRPPLVHCANSAAALRKPDAVYDLVRVGIAMYGLHPSSVCKLPGVVRPALSWKSCLAQVKVLPPGRGISYGHIYTTKAEERIGTIPVGYADGFRRVEGNEVLVGGKRVPVVGRVTMDQIMVQLDALPSAQPGDEVVIIGSQERERISAEDVAERWGTINYEVTSGILKRVTRVYT